jgi:hypothetical protein
MGRILGAIKAVFFWSYARNTWQWDVLCVLILAFIFLTPKSWFETGELRHTGEHPNRFASTLLIAPGLPDDQRDRGEIERRVRALSGRPDAEVTAIRQKFDEKGKVAALEVDIR